MQCAYPDASELSIDATASQLALAAIFLGTPGFPLCEFGVTHSQIRVDWSVVDKGCNVLDLWIILSWVDRLNWASGGLHLAHSAESRSLDNSALGSWNRAADRSGETWGSEASGSWEGGAEGAVDSRHVSVHFK